MTNVFIGQTKKGATVKDCLKNLHDASVYFRTTSGIYSKQNDLLRAHYKMHIKYSDTLLIMKLPPLDAKRVTVSKFIFTHFINKKFSNQP